MPSVQRIVLGLFAAATIVAAGCAGGTHSALPAGPSAASGAATHSGSLNATTSKTFKVTSISRWHRQHSDIEIVSLLGLDVDHGDATFRTFGHWDCFLRGDGRFSTGATKARADSDWEDGLIYWAQSDQTFPIPAFTLENECAHGRSWDHHHDADTHNYYVLMISIPDFTVQAVAGPGASANDDDLSFPAANAPLQLQAQNGYAFVLVRTSGSIPTPTPMPTPTPTPIPPGCRSFAGITGPAPALKSTPAPVLTAAPNGFFSFYPMPNSVAPGSLTCGPQLKVYGTMGAPGFFSLDPTTGTITPVSAGTRFASHAIAAGGDNELYVDPGISKTPTVVRANPDGTGATTISLGMGIGGVTTLTTGGDGNIYAPAKNNGALSLFQIRPDATFTAFAAPATCLSFPSVTTDAQGSILALDTTGCGIAAMTTAGAFSVLSAAPVGDTVTALAPGPDGAVYYGSRTQTAIVRVDASGATRAYAMPAEANDVQAIVAGVDGNLWFSADHFDGSVRSGGVIGRLNLKTGAITEVATTVSGANDPNTSGGDSETNPLHLTLGPDHNIYGSTTSGQNNVIKVVPLALP